MQLTLWQWLVQGIPECISYTMLAWILLSNKFNFKSIIIIGVIQAVILFLFRLLPLPFGLHSLIGVISLSALLTVFIKSRYSAALIVSLLVVVFLGVLELILIPLQARLYNLPIELLFTDPLLAALTGLVQVVVIFAVTLVVYKYKKANKNKR